MQHEFPDPDLIETTTPVCGAEYNIHSVLGSDDPLSPMTQRNIGHQALVVPVGQWDPAVIGCIFL